MLPFTGDRIPTMSFLTRGSRAWPGAPPFTLGALLRVSWTAVSEWLVSWHRKDRAARRALVALALSPVACSPHAPRGEAVQPPRPAASAPPVATLAASAPAATTPVPAPPAAAGPRGEPPPRTGAPGSTRGTISCGKTRCAAPGELCVWSESAFAWTCVPAPGPDAGAPGDSYACDDGTDCPAGETCCRPFANMGSPSCVRREDVSSTCQMELCLREGARCPAGRTCTSRGGDEPGDCLAPPGPATCGGGARCPAGAPFCVSNQGKLACAARGSPAWKAATARYECTLQSDCSAGDTCSFAFGEAEPEVTSYCSRYSSGYMGTLVCDPRDQSLCGKDAACRAARPCVGSTPELPWLGGWLKQW
jgi:hypothetical protein